MKIVNRNQFMALPAETMYSTYEPCCFGPLYIKGDTIIHDGKPIDWCYQDIADAVDAGDSGEWAEKLFEAQESGGSVAFDFDCQGRDGMFAHDQLYAVWEPQDVVALIDRLRRCVPVIPAKDWLDEEDFYEHCQAYRTAPSGDQPYVITQFEALKQFVRRHTLTPGGRQP
jgi:hypothetical protein